MVCAAMVVFDHVQRGDGFLDPLIEDSLNSLRGDSC